MTATLAVAAVPAEAAPVAATKAATACPTGWGSLDKTFTASTSKPLKNIRTGRHDCYDRMVFDVPGAGTSELGYSVGYVDQFYLDGSGRLVPVTGGAIIEVRLHAPAYDPETGTASYPGVPGRVLPGVNLTGYRTFKDAKYGVSFEGDTQVAIGVRARLPFRVQVLPDHIVVDVAHTW